MRISILIIFCFYSAFAFCQKDDFFDTDSIIDFEEHCVRSVPEPVLESSKFSDYKFELRNNVGFEQVLLLNGDKLIIKNCGCEYYTLVFRLEVTKPQDQKNESVERWYKEIPKRLAMIEDLSDSPFDLNKAKLLLINYIDSYNNHPLKYKHEIVIEAGEMPTKMSLDYVRILNDKTVALELSIWIGPL